MYLFALALFAMAAILGHDASAHSRQDVSADHAALLALAAKLDEAWGRADASANADLFSASATARFGEEPLGVGRASIRQQFEGFFTDRPPGLRHVTVIERAETLGLNLAMWDAEVRVERMTAAGKWEAVTRIRNVTIAVRESGQWRIRAVRAFPLA